MPPDQVLPDWVSDTVDDPEYSLFVVMGGYYNSVKHARDLDWSDWRWQGGPLGRGSSIEKVWFADQDYSVHMCEGGAYFYVKRRVDVRLISPEETRKREKAGVPLPDPTTYFVFVYGSYSFPVAIRAARIMNYCLAAGIDFDRHRLYYTLRGGPNS